MDFSFYGGLSKSTPKSDGLKNEAFGVNAIVGYTFRSRHTTYSWEVTCYHLQWRHSRPNREMPLRTILYLNFRSSCDKH